MKLERPYTAWLALTLAALFPLSLPAQDENWAATINHLRDLYHQHKYEEALPLAGKPSPPDLDNGVLTALEAGNLNLRGTQLVVLSACDTGQGDVKNGEGVFGLRRALQEAGAQAVLMSLWSVPDQETQQLMQRFYARWLSGIEVHQALKDAQLAMRAQVRAAHGGNDLPYYWGAFVLVGR